MRDYRSLKLSTKSDLTVSGSIHERCAIMDPHSPAIAKHTVMSSDPRYWEQGGVKVSWGVCVMENLRI